MFTSKKEYKPIKQNVINFSLICEYYEGLISRERIIRKEAEEVTVRRSPLLERGEEKHVSRPHREAEWWNISNAPT